MGRLLVASRRIAELTRPSPQEFSLVQADDFGGLARFLAEQSGSGIEAILCSGLESIGAAELASLPDLRLVVALASGTSGIDKDALKARGVLLTNAGTLHADDVADHTVAMILASRRDIVSNHLWMLEDRWLMGRPKPGRSLAGQRVGIVGLGAIGERVAVRLGVFGMVVRWWGPSPKPGSAWPRMSTIAELATWSDILVVAVRADENCKRLIDRNIISAVGPAGLLVNVSRGFVVDQPALLEALRTGRLGAAALDVFDPEPTAASQWRDVSRLLVSPHIAGGTEEAHSMLAQGALDNVRRLFSGRPLLNSVL